MKTDITTKDSRRSGTVLILVVVILAILMGLAATLALVTRVEMRMSENYVYEQTIAQAADAVEIYASDHLLTDEEAFLFHDAYPSFAIAAENEVTGALESTLDDSAAQWTTDEFAGASVVITGGTGEGQRREIASNTEDTLTVTPDWDPIPDDTSRYRIIVPKTYLLGAGEDINDGLWVKTQDIDELPDAFNIRRRGEDVDLRARFILHFEDLGGSRLDVNMTGNTAGTEDYGATTFETRLGDIVTDVEGIITERGYGDAAFYGYDEAANEFTYNPDYPDGQNPFGAGGLLDCALAGFYHEFAMEDRPGWLKEYVLGSRLGDIVDAGQALYLTTASAANIVADFVSAGQLENDFAEYAQVMKWLDEDDFESIGAGEFPFTDAGEILLLQRPLRHIIRELQDNPGAEDGVGLFRDFLEYVHDGDKFTLSGASISQIALNIWNMMAYIYGDADYVYEWADNGTTYYGVVPGVPYVAEVVAHTMPYDEDPEGGSPDESELDRAKYIKLLNPWPADVDSLEVDVIINGVMIGSVDIASHDHYLFVADDSVEVHNDTLPAGKFAADEEIKTLTGGDTIKLRLPGTGTVVWQTNVAASPDGQNESSQIRDPRSRSHQWEDVSPVPGWDPPTWAWDEEEEEGSWSWGGNAGWSWPEDETYALSWFNRNWRDELGPDISIGSGDNWFRLHADPESVPPDNPHNLLDSFRVPSFLISPADLTYVHAGIDWCTLSPSSDATALGAADVVFLRGLSKYLIGNSPYEHGDAGDSIYGPDDQPGYDERYDRLGPPFRLHGRVNVNTAPQDVLQAAIARNVIENVWEVDDTESDAVINDIASAIVTEREGGNAPFENLDDLFDRVPEIFGYKEDGWNNADPDLLTVNAESQPNSPDRHALARSLYNRVTVRTDVWGVTGRVQLYEAGDDYLTDPDDYEVLTERAFYSVIDRSFLPPRVLLRTELPLEQ